MFKIMQLCFSNRFLFIYWRTTKKHAPKTIHPVKTIGKV